MSALENGTESLVQALYSEIKKTAKIYLNHPVKNIPKSPNVIISAHAQGASDLLIKDCPVSARALSNVRYAPIVCCTVFLKKITIK